MNASDRRVARVMEALSGRRALPADAGPSMHNLFNRVGAIVRDSSIRGMAIAPKTIADGQSGESALVFYVREKLPRSGLDARLLIPPVILDLNGRSVLTDVRAIGDVVADANIGNSPIRSGYSIGHAAGRTGTLAAVVRRGSASYLLSAKHVLAADGRAVAGDPILYPSANDGGALPSANVATLLAFSPFLQGPDYPNEVDAALAEVMPARVTDLDPSLPGATVPLRVGTATKGMAVSIMGRTSGERVWSTVEAIPADVRIRYPGLGYLGFRGQVGCPAYTQGGDSGALVINDAGETVGLHIGGSDTMSFFTPIQAVLSALQISL